MDTQPRARPPELHVKWQQAERIAEWIVEDADVRAGLRSVS